MCDATALSTTMRDGKEQGGQTSLKALINDATKTGSKPRKVEEARVRYLPSIYLMSIS